ncbi:MAG: hypothetical protein DRR42_17680 [Gammaproteobacteria bacterium]|nr:MAG: hypothetical protein DRR42_17680 [Gammaproteobacteria bacterium]
MRNGVKRSTIEKLLKVSETSEASIIERLANEEFGDQFHELVDNNILIHFKILKSIDVFDGENEFVADIQRRDGENMYFSPADGWVAVSDEDINLYKVSFDWLLRKIMDALDIADRHVPKEILEDKIWVLSQHRIEKQNINIIVVRNIKNAIVFDALTNYLNNHHNVRNPALVIALDQQLPAHLQLPDQNNLVRIGEAIKWDKEAFELNTALLAGRMGGTISKPGFSIGYRTLVSNGLPYKFTKKQAEALEYLDKNNGKPIHQDEILAGINSAQSKLLQLFRSKGQKHPAWGVIIQGDGNGNYWLEY